MFGFGAHPLDIPELFPMVEKVLASFTLPDKGFEGLLTN